MLTAFIKDSTFLISGLPFYNMNPYMYRCSLSLFLHSLRIELQRINTENDDILATAILESDTNVSLIKESHILY